MKSNFNNLITSLMNTGKSPYKNYADRIRGISDEITNELVFDEEHHVKLKSMVNPSEKSLKEFKNENNSSEIITSKELKPLKTYEVTDRWLELKKVGAGLRNQGNTCFLNSTLQCLFYSKPLFNYLLSIKHSSNCMNGKLCMVCEMKSLVKSCLLQNNSVVSPVSILKKLKQIARHMKWGSQEDAHEFLRHVIDALHRCSLHKNPCSPSKKSSPIMKLFGGLLKSQIVCMQCNMESIKLDPFMDVSLEVRGVPSIEAGLARFTKAEVLDGDNAYLCKNCKKKVRAKKRFIFYRLPEILTIQFKRYSMGGGKVSNHISFPSCLNLAPYTQDPSLKPHNNNNTNIVTNNHTNGFNNTNNHNGSNNTSNSKFNHLIDHSNNDIQSNKNTDLSNHLTNTSMPLKSCKASTYQLYAVLVHEGGSTSSGHYYSYVRAPNAAWYCMNDSHVFQTSLNHVLKSQAYLLFYHRTPKPPTPTTSNSKLMQSPTKNARNYLPTLKSPQSSSSSLPSSFSSSLQLHTTNSPTKELKSSKPFTLNINDVLSKKKEKVIINPSTFEIIDVHPSKSQTSNHNTFPIKSKSDSSCGLQIVGKSLKSSVKDKEESKSSSSSSSSSSYLSSLSSSSSSSMSAKIRGGEMEKVESSAVKKAYHEATKRPRNFLDTVKYTSIWKIKPFVIKSLSDHGGGKGSSEVMNGGNGESKNPFNCLVRRSTSGLWRVEQMDGKVFDKKVKPRQLEKINGKLKGTKVITRTIQGENSSRGNACFEVFDKGVKESTKKVIQNGLNASKELKVTSNKINKKSPIINHQNSYSFQHNRKQDFEINGNDENKEDSDEDDEVEKKEEIKARKPVVQCATFNWDSNGQSLKDKNKDEMKMKKKKMDLERLADSAFSVPVSRWDGKEDEIKEEEKKKRDIESRRKRKYEEMDEEIDSGRLKKVKAKKNFLSKPDVNPFQIWQNKNYKKFRLDNGD